nr:hypothetical protein CFP56_15778 [Quercus suber]
MGQQLNEWPNFIFDSGFFISKFSLWVESVKLFEYREIIRKIGSGKSGKSEGNRGGRGGNGLGLLAVNTNRRREARKRLLLSSLAEDPISILIPIMI